MKRILIVALQQEVSSFNPVRSTRADFQEHPGQDMRQAFAGTDTYAGGALEVLERAADVTPICVYSATACSAGTLQHEDFLALKATLLDAVREHMADGIDGILFLLHGAMATTAETDPEGDILETVRALVGPKPAFTMSLDLHGILTARMIAACPAFETLRTYPHVDFADTGARAARLMLRLLREDLCPVVARLRIPMLVRGDECITETGIYGQYMARAMARAASDGLLAATVMIGNPFTDVPELCCQVLAISDGDAQKAETAVRDIADGFFDHRATMQADLVSLNDAIGLARDGRFPLILKDAADAPSSGASGDSAELIHALLDADVTATILAPIVDAPTVARAFELGVGVTACFHLGGSGDRRFTPVKVKAKVAMLSDGHYRMETWGTWDSAGPCAKLRSGNLTVIASTRPVQLFDRSLFLGHGEDPRGFDITVVKSPHCQHRYFDAWADTVVSVDAQGATSARIETLGHRLCQRPIYPLDPITTFTPQIEIFS
ncbi:M81 family metallopeptidase [Primorskyibacter marinus]|uniref:M81 family metallopeptidase n=1 Tax=Primorskyibacter marinus TaxID=1977320 RepID=UPI000E302A97|nr:M81 family metallopeptidase [Primorskyibacter marinus]